MNLIEEALARAVKKWTVFQAVKTRLAPLPLETQRTIVAELLVELEPLVPRTRLDRLVAFVRANPRSPIDEIAEAIYDGDPAGPSKNYVRVMLSQLKREGRAINVAPGQWEIVE